MRFDREEVIHAFATIGMYCLEKGDCGECKLKELCAGQVEDALYNFALQAALKI